MCNVRVVTLPTCPNCIEVKRFLESHSIGFTEINGLSDEGREMMESEGIVFVPAIFIENKPPIVGFNRRKLVSMLGIEQKDEAKKCF